MRFLPLAQSLLYHETSMEEATSFSRRWPLATVFKLILSIAPILRQ
ncbi:hypothetical protein SAMN05518846_106157 [Brevibacillus centrosporus]|uniref:Uncharacterized protein n=1 Tax=Brevibacillus centrosporus TaxID=54910 RepID=A0A1I3UY57_9BACL|nr:hypothetical protein SAMN05518846_106157 [Brevibacillus centrosporus]